MKRFSYPSALLSIIIEFNEVHSKHTELFSGPSLSNSSNRVRFTNPDLSFSAFHSSVCGATTAHENNRIIPSTPIASWPRAAQQACGRSDRYTICANSRKPTFGTVELLQLDKCFTAQVSVSISRFSSRYIIILIFAHHLAFFLSGPLHHLRSHICFSHTYLHYLRGQ